LNKSEFKDAQQMLDEEIQKLGQQGAIGKARKTSIDEVEKAETAARSAATSANKLAKSNKISQAEFTYYVHAAVEQADYQWREMRAQADAHRKAYNLQRQMYSRRGHPRYPYPYSPY
jgi:hypothetical protein